MNCPHCNTPLSLVVAGGGDSRRNPAPSGQKSKSFPVDVDEIKLLFGQIEDGRMLGIEMDARSENFVRESVARFDEYGARMLVSEPQMEWLRKLAIAAQAD